jgi:cytochrome c oxidase subunit 2
MLELLSRLFSPVYCDAPEPWQIGFQDAGSPIAEGIQNLHNEIFFYLIVIFVGVGWVLGSIVVNYSQDKSPIVYKYANHGRKWLMCSLYMHTYVCALLITISCKG